MKRKLLLIALITLIAILSYQIQSFEWILILLILLAIVFVIISGIKNYFKRINPKYFKLPGALIIICLFGIGTSLLRPYEKAILDTGSVSQKLLYAYTTDQNDRKQIRSFIKGLSELGHRDSIRLDQVKNIYDQDKIVKPIDKFYAAFIFHHSNNSTDYEIASKLATAAAGDKELLQHYQVQWLAKASYDRWMVSIGRKEKYNTQNKISVDF